MKIYRLEAPDEKTLGELLLFIEEDFKKNKDNSLNKQNFSYFKNRILKKIALNPYYQLYIARNQGIIIGYVFLIFLEWDTKIFGFKIGRIENISMKMNDSLKANFVKNIIQDCRKDKYRHINCRIGLNNFETLHLMEGFEFNVVDIQLTLTTPKQFRKSVLLLPSEFVIRVAKFEDLTRLQEITKDAFTDTRFVVDRRYPSEGVNRLYFEWIRNSIADPIKKVFLCEGKSTKNLVGFSIYGLDPDTKKFYGQMIGSIDLIVMGKNYRNIGIGQELIKSALNWFNEKADKVEIRTQVSNLPAIRAFMSGGFKEITQGIVLPAGISMHRWF